MPGTRRWATARLVALVDAVAQTRFEPARALTGAPVAVNMVWLVAQTRVRGKTMTLVPMPACRAADWTVPVGRPRAGRGRRG